MKIGTICTKLSALFCLCLGIVSCTEKEEMGAYLFTYFNDPTHSLFMAISYDGYEFTAINGSDPIINGAEISEQKGIRDPHIQRVHSIS